MENLLFLGVPILKHIRVGRCQDVNIIAHEMYWRRNVSCMLNLAFLPIYSIILEFIGAEDTH